MELQKIYSDNTKILSAFAESRIGGRQENQDSYGWQDTPFGYLVVVCDGMGGGPGGKTASTIAVNEIVSAISDANKEEEIPNIIIKSIRRANMAIIEAGNENPKLNGMGSTATVLLVSEKSAYIAHVGDSRVYQIRDGKKIFRTFDHSMVFEMVEQGIITEEQARLSAQSNVITRALGIRHDIEVDICERPYKKGDRFMLCSDGIHGSLPEEKLLKAISEKNHKLGAVIDDVATMIDNIGRSNGGGHDNLTLAVVQMNINSKLKPAMSRQSKLTILSLAVLLIISICTNIFFLTDRKKQSTNDHDEITILKDSIAHKTDSIRNLQTSITLIEKQAKEISGNNIAPVDSIKIIINKIK